MADRPLHFQLEGRDIAPFLEGTEDPSHVYVRRHEPTVVLGGRDSGVANPARPSGVTFLDKLWSGAPLRLEVRAFQGVGDPQHAMGRGGLLSSSQRSTILATAKAATFVP